MKLDFLKNFYSDKYNEKSLLQAIDSILNSHDNLQAKAFPCYIASPFFHSLIDNNNEDIRLISKSVDTYLFSYKRKIKSKNNNETISGKFFIVINPSYKDVYSVITVDSSDFFNRGLLPFFRKHYPKTSLTFITHKKLKTMMVDFRTKNSLRDFLIVRTSMKSRIEKKVMSSVNWPEFTLEKAFDWVSEENGWFESIVVEAKRGMAPTFRISISREGVIKGNNFFTLIYNDILSPIAKTVFDNVTFFGRRARLENNGEIKPLALLFEHNQFESVEENKKFIEAMSKMKATSVSVIHGNPYIQLSVFDYYDGSSYDIWVLSNNKIIIVPQLKSSFQAVKRLINHIFDNYYEANIEEYILENA